MTTSKRPFPQAPSPENSENDALSAPLNDSGMSEIERIMARQMQAMEAHTENMNAHAQNMVGIINHQLEVLQHFNLSPAAVPAPSPATAESPVTQAPAQPFSTPSPPPPASPAPTVSEPSPSTVTPSAEPVSRYYPMSSVQKRLFALSQTEGGDRAYNVLQAVRITGPLDIDRVRWVFDQLIRRHSVFRTGLEVRGEELVQQVYPFDEIEFSIDYREEMDADTTLDSLASAVIQPFDLSKPPLMRILIGRESWNEFLLITNFHHSILDGTSFTLFMRDFMYLYRDSPLPPVAMKYHEYTGWELQYYDSPEFREQREFWGNVLSDDLPVLELPADFPRPETMEFEGNIINFTISSEKTQAAKVLARESRATLNMLLTAHVNILLAKLTGKEDIILGIPAAVKEHEDLENTIGMFTNSVVLRNHPVGTKTFTAFLEEVKRRSLEAFTHQAYPYEELVRQLDAQRDISHNPIFDVMFSYENGDQRFHDVPGLSFTTIHMDAHASPFDLFSKPSRNTVTWM